jgi:hypothetical protein
MMSELQEIDVFIEFDGTVKIEVRGVKGRKCTSLTKNMEQLLGGEVVDRNYSDEFNEEPLFELDPDRLKTRI